MENNGISVIMPTYNQCSFISRAIKSILLQQYQNWELIIINDNSFDNTEKVIERFLKDNRIKYFLNEENIGLGACLNKGIQFASFDLIAYLPSDDLYFSTHLLSLYQKIKSNNNAFIAYSGIKYNYQDGGTLSIAQKSNGKIYNSHYQLIQILHYKTEDKWMERDELVTDDLDRMFWAKLFKRGISVSTGQITCEWISHPEQRHKFIIETLNGGIYAYKNHYRVHKPIRFQSSQGCFIDEIETYKNFQISASSSHNKLKILLVGELSYNPERFFALEAKGHQLYGLWITSPLIYNAIGPLPFGNIIDIPYDDRWIDRVSEIKPDIIYGLLNFSAVPLANQVLMSGLDIPFVWHFKESPFYCRQYGIWKELIQLYTNSDGQIYLNPETKSWFEQFLPPKKEHCSFILDGDLPVANWFAGERSTLLSDTDGEIHTVVPGRPIGIEPDHIVQLSKKKIHLHFYGDVHQEVWRDWIDTVNQLAPGYLHIHPNCSPENWLREFSQYDAGWLHYFESDNFGELIKANWVDLNIPARLTTLAVAGLPVLQKDNSEHIVATQNIIRELDIGLLFSSIDDLSAQLYNKKRMDQLRENMWKNRLRFSFDYHLDDLICFFRRIIEDKKPANQGLK